MAKKQAWHCHLFIWSYKWSRECWNSTRILTKDGSSVDKVFNEQVPSELGANSQNTGNHSPSAITMYKQPRGISDNQLRQSVRSLNN